MSILIKQLFSRPRLGDFLLLLCLGGLLCGVDVKGDPAHHQKSKSGRERPIPVMDGDDCNDKMIGKGWFQNEKANKITFNFSVMPGKEGILKGRLQLVDRAKRIRVRATRVLAHREINATTREIDYEARVNNQRVVARVIATDFGKSGKRDTFELLLPIGYQIGGTFGVTIAGKGNNQLIRQ